MGNKTLKECRNPQNPLLEKRFRGYGRPPRDRQKLFEKCKKAIIDNEYCWFWQDLAYLVSVPCSNMLYFFPKNSDEYYELANLLGQNRLHEKFKLRKDLSESGDSAKIHIYKTISDPEERNNYNDKVTLEANVNANVAKLTASEAKQMLKELDDEF